jgi:DNA relaxase NicK
LSKRNTIFKNFEAQIGEWFGVRRNPLSGRNNRDDSGKKRLGDVLYKHALVEGKTRRKNSVFTRVYETKKLAGENKVPWIHFERLVGDTKTIITVCDEDLLIKFIKLIDLLFRDTKFAEEILSLIDQRLKELKENESKDSNPK